MLNRKSFIEKSTEILNAYKGTGSVYLFYADFVEFKLVNYYYGIEKGNELLQAVVDFVRNIPEVACCERVFSDQFVFIVLAKAKRTDDEIVASYNYYAEKFIATQRDKYPACNLKFCCGIFPVKTNNIIEAIDNANMAHMDAKKMGGVTAVLFKKSKLEELSAKQKQEKELALALHENRFSFYLQPKVDLLTGQIIGAEALARRFDSDGKVIYPDSFIPIMEENGSIVDLDLMIFEKVCEFIEERLQKGFPVVCTSVNLSRLHIQDMETAHRLHSIAQKHHIPPRLLEFELTESILLTEFAGAKNLGSKLRNYQYQTSVDDFGSGYAGINIWQELDFDGLKLDKKFLSDDAEIKVRNSAIVPSLIDIAHKLGTQVICEGVERVDQCRRLLQMGCRYAQGFYFSQAVPPKQFYKMYQEQRGHISLPFHVDIDIDEEPNKH
jgi:EAL domain-containing protein (putative c-di-GMP-specific phosphodiesterase class I)